MRCHGMLPQDRRISGAQWYGRSAPPIPGTVQPGRDAVGTLVDVEEPRQRTGGVQPQEPGQPAAAQRPDVAHGVVVEPPGEARPGWSCRRGRSAAPSGRPARSAGSSRSSRPRTFSASSRSPSAGVARVRGEGRQVLRPVLSHGRRVVARQLLGQAGPPLQLGVQGRPGPRDPGLEPPQPGERPGRPGARSRSTTATASSQASGVTGGQATAAPAAARGQASAARRRGRRGSRRRPPPVTSPPPAGTTVS